MAADKATIKNALRSAGRFFKVEFAASLALVGLGWQDAPRRD